jgi:hypothetical protein
MTAALIRDWTHPSCVAKELTLCCLLTRSRSRLPCPGGLTKLAACAPGVDRVGVVDGAPVALLYLPDALEGQWCGAAGAEAGAESRPYEDPPEYARGRSGRGQSDPSAPPKGVETPSLLHAAVVGLIRGPGASKNWPGFKGPEPDPTGPYRVVPRPIRAGSDREVFGGVAALQGGEPGSSPISGTCFPVQRLVSL